MPLHSVGDGYGGTLIQVELSCGARTLFFPQVTAYVIQGSSRP